MTMPNEPLDEADWRMLRSIRLLALQQDPRAFLSNFEEESRYDEGKWREEFTRGNWTLLMEGGQAVGLLGATWEPGTPHTICYLEYMWIHPQFRNKGRAAKLVTNVLKRMAGEGVTTVRLWVLDGNDTAARVYERIGFRFTGKRQPLPQEPSRNENLMELGLHSSIWSEDSGTQ